MVDESQGSIKA